MTINTETWAERYARLLKRSTLTMTPSERSGQASFDADKEMLDEIHEMLRHLMRESGNSKLGH